MANDVKTGSNEPDKELLARFVTEIERHEETLLTYRGEHMRRCKSVRELIANVKDRAKDAGFPKKEFAALLKQRGLARKIEAIREDMEQDEQEYYDMIVDALGEFANTPLGQEAVSKARKKADAAQRKRDREAADELAG